MFLPALGHSGAGEEGCLTQRSSVLRGRKQEAGSARLLGRVGAGGGAGRGVGRGLLGGGDAGWASPLLGPGPSAGRAGAGLAVRRPRIL